MSKPKTLHCIAVRFPRLYAPKHKEVSLFFDTNLRLRTPGTNDDHGAGQELFRDTSLDTNSYFNKIRRRGWSAQPRPAGN
jgi:hypothetical protein